MVTMMDRIRHSLVVYELMRKVITLKVNIDSIKQLGTLIYLYIYNLYVRTYVYTVDMGGLVR